MPSTSVVVASWGGEELVVACLESLMHQATDAEVLVVTNGPPDATARLRERYPAAGFVQAEPDATVFRMRAIGAAMAKGDLVALIEDHATVSPGWIRALRSAREAGHAIIGGPVANGLTERALDWALYFVEYGYHVPPIPEGPVASLSGVNIAYARQALDSCRSVWSGTLQENEVNDALARLGWRPHLAPEARVETHLPMTLPEASAHLFGGGRHFARYRSSQAPLVKRLAWLVTSPAVPLVLLARLVDRTARRDPRLLGKMLLGAIYLAIVLGAWGLGESRGYLDGLLRGRDGAVE